MFIGKNFDYSRCLTWVPMLNDISYYSLTMAEVVYDDQEQLLGSNQAFVLDSGTTNTYFVDPLYQQLLSLVTKTPLQKTPGDEGYRHCWKGTKPFNSISDIRSYFPTLKLKFREGRVMEIPPDNYFIIREIGDACLGIFNGSDIKLSFNLIGAISMQNVMVVYDNEQQKIGWARVAGCSNPPVGICAP
ncbi:Aspartic proteinase Asp1 [Dendrobium catenatum]|uniref:Aspartic proteinase Asp1 n=1 Tax=Dendrobium catenatum TaxID=906689 RepID=A0A2I0W4E7_9ASPA|nr:Aspartic proteinase Asp1 [Dendrobium catenatum]